MTIQIAQANALYTKAFPSDKTYLTISAEGVISLGPNVAWDEAAEFLLDALERQIGRRLVGVERAASTMFECAMTRGHYINRRAFTGSQIVTLRAAIPELEKLARRTPPKTLVAERAKVVEAARQLATAKARLLALEEEHAEWLRLESLPSNSEGSGEKRGTITVNLESGDPPEGSRLWRCEQELRKARGHLRSIIHWVTEAPFPKGMYLIDKGHIDALRDAYELPDGFTSEEVSAEKLLASAGATQRQGEGESR